MDNARLHLDFLDLAKGIGIILVVMEHTIFPLHEAISLFHMPLFFILAGLTLKPYNDLGGFLLKKIDRIFIPYIFFSILSWLLAMAIHSEAGIINSPLWFLHSLFFAVIICEVVIYSIPKYTFIVTCFLLMSRVFSINIKRVCICFCYIIGFMIKYISHPV